MQPYAASPTESCYHPYTNIYIIEYKVGGKCFFLIYFDQQLKITRHLFSMLDLFFFCLALFLSLLFVFIFLGIFSHYLPSFVGDRVHVGDISSLPFIPMPSNNSCNHTFVSQKKKSWSIPHIVLGHGCLRVKKPFLAYYSIFRYDFIRPCSICLAISNLIAFSAFSLSSLTFGSDEVDIRISG